jgi:hypothetical protein
MGSIDDVYQKFCRRRFPLPPESTVAALEHRIGIRLPADFRAFVLAYNGGFFRSPSIRPVGQGCPEDALDFLSGIDASHPCAELASERDLTLFDDNEPVQVLPIGYTVIGNLLILLTDPENAGAIMLKRMYSDDYFLLARTMDQFFSLLAGDDG